MSGLNDIIYKVTQNQQEMNNNISMITTNINDFKEIDPKYLYFLSPSIKNMDKKKYTYLKSYDDKKYLYIKNDLIYYTFPSNIDNITNYIDELIKYNPYLLEIKIPNIYGNIVIPGFIKKKIDEFYVYYRYFIEIYSLYKPNIPQIELDKIIDILKICQPFQLYIHHSNIKNMEVFLNQYYIRQTNMTKEPNFDYFTINSYTTPNNLTEEEFSNLIHILLVIKPFQLYIHHSNTKNMEVFLNQYYIRQTNMTNEPNFDYFTINSYTIPNNLTEEDFTYLINILLVMKPNELFNIPPINSYTIPNNLTEEDFNYLIHILLVMKPNELYIPNEQYIYNFYSNYNKLLSPLLNFYAKKKYNRNGYSYYEKRNI